MDAHADAGRSVRTLLLAKLTAACMAPALLDVRRTAFPGHLVTHGARYPAMAAPVCIPPPARRSRYGPEAMPSLFTRIIEREIPAHILREDDNFLAILDVRPIREGHSLVVPKAEIPDIFDLPESLLAGLLPFARPVARAIRQVTQATRIGIAVVGLEIPHTHVHLVPIDELYDLDFRRARPAAEEELAATAERIRAALAS